MMYDDIMTSLVNMADKLEKLGFYNRANLLDETRSIIKYLQSRNEFITRLEKMAFLSPTEMHDDKDYITKDEGKIILWAAELIKELESKKFQEDKIDILFLEARAGAEQRRISAFSPAPEAQIIASTGAAEVSELVRLVERARELVPNLYDSWHQAAEEALASRPQDTNTVEDHETEKVEDNRTCATEGCNSPATNEFVRGDVGSFYCGDCFGKVIEVCEVRPAAGAQQERSAEQAVTDAGLIRFAEWFRKNYPGPDTIIHKPDWHAPKIYRAALIAAMEAKE